MRGLAIVLMVLAPAFAGVTVSIVAPIAAFLIDSYTKGLQP